MIERDGETQVNPETPGSIDDLRASISSARRRASDFEKDLQERRMAAAIVERLAIDKHVMEILKEDFRVWLEQEKLQCIHDVKGWLLISIFGIFITIFLWFLFKK